MVKEGLKKSYIAIPRIFRLYAISILDREKIEYEFVNKDDLPDGKYDLCAQVNGKIYHCPQVYVLYTKAEKKSFIAALEEAIMSRIKITKPN